MTKKDLRLEYKVDTGDKKPFEEELANKEYVEWLEEKVIKLTEELEENGENFIGEVIQL